VISPLFYFFVFIIYSICYYLYLHSFPTRRSSDLNNLIQRNQSAAFSSGKVRPNHETNINIIARRTGNNVYVGFMVWSNFTATKRSEERFSRNAETDLVCRLLLEKKKQKS